MGMPESLQGIAATLDRAQTSTAGRLVSLDAFRGATMAFMILVNTPGDGRHVYWPLEHAQWNGWTPTDVVFPSFLWIVGVAITLSLGRRLERGESRADLFRKAAGRGCILFALGMLVYVYPAFDLSTQRILGVLQRIAICYVASAAIFLTAKLRGRIAWIVSLMAVYWLLMAFAPTPGYGPGRLDVEGNFAHYVDRMVLGSHNYHQTRTWDTGGHRQHAAGDRYLPAGRIGRPDPGLAAKPLGPLLAPGGPGRHPAGGRPHLQHLAAHQQEALDRFLYALHGGPGFPVFRRLPVAGGWPGQAPPGETYGDLRIPTRSSFTW